MTPPSLALLGAKFKLTPALFLVCVLIVMGPKGPSRSRPAQASFKIQPKMTKWEVKEYLTKIYDVPVKKVKGTVLQSVACLVQPAVAWTHLEILLVWCLCIPVAFVRVDATLAERSESHRCGRQGPNNRSMCFCGA